MIEGPEWIVLIVFIGGVLLCLYWVISVQGDLMIDDTEKGSNSDDATKMFLYLVNQTNRSIVIHDDGDNTTESMYNNGLVIETIRNRVQTHNISVNCLFNDEGEDLAFLDLAREFPNNIRVAYLSGGRPDPDTHYKIVDEGKLVHLSSHEHGEIERKFVLRKPPYWAIGTRHRICKAFMNHYKHGLQGAKRLVA